MSSNREKDIAEMYRSGAPVREIRERFNPIENRELYAALRAHGVKKRGQGSHFKKLWAAARANGVHAVTGAPLKNAVVLAAKTVKVAGSTSPGIIALKALLASGTISQSDIDALATKKVIAPVPKGKDLSGITHLTAYHNIEKHLKAGRLTQQEMARCERVSLSTVVRYIKHIRG